MKYIENPPNPWLNTNIEWIGEPPESKLEIYEETATRSIITKNNSPDVSFDYSINSYRGCIHGCTYCFSRPTHEYLGFGAGTDFDRKIVAKVRAPELLREELSKPSWKGEDLMFSFTSDPYVPIESHYQLTRRCFEVCLEFRQPVGVITKSALVRRDIDLLVELSKHARCSVCFTIPFLDKETSRAVEPYAPSPDARFAAMKELTDAGIEVGLALAPVIPGLNDSHIPDLLKRAAEAGASSAFMSMLRLPGSVASYFETRLRENLPTKADRVMNHIREERGGKLNSSEFGKRMSGTSEQWKVAVNTFKVHSQRLGLNRDRDDEKPKTRTFRRPTRQNSLFD